MKLHRLILLLILISLQANVFAVDDETYVSLKSGAGYFPLFANGKAPSLYASPDDYTGVLRAVRDLQFDIERVTGVKPELMVDAKSLAVLPVIIGTVGKSALIDELIRSGKLNVEHIQGKWEAFIVQVIENPLPGVDQALVIVGSDKRGTIFGIYDLSQQIGVSPWFWWADVPVTKQTSLYVIPGMHTKGEPAVKYRGIFINDEQPALGGWVAKNYGGFKSGFYEKVFELILRMKGNFLWPAMWGQSFFTDDPRNPELADEYGIVISTSHHEPLMRAHVEWQRNEGGAWNYQTNADELRKFWKEGIERMGDNESVVTLAMRGDGDEPMSEESNIQLLQRIVEDQRKIIEETTGKPAEETPQVWALYKEVQDYFDKGMRVPDDVTLLLCDDNWGNIRKLPKLNEKLHPGGYGIYYHYDYVGGPRNYKWLNTNPIAKVWEQMHLAYEYNAREIWIVNVGDIKPMEFPIEFFLDYAWNPEKWPQDKLQEYTERWAAREFGAAHAKEIADIMSLYTKYNGRRKPELLAPDFFSPNLYSLTNYREAERIVNAYNNLAQRADAVAAQLPAAYRDAYHQLILFPVKACANLNELYYTVRLNRMYAEQHRAGTNALKEKAEQLFHNDAALTKYYNETMSNGKWNHFMDQLHIGYVGWHDTFNKNTLPEVKTVEPVEGAAMGLVVEGDKAWWPDSKDEPTITFNKFQTQVRYIEIFNQGKVPLTFSISAKSPALRISEKKGKVATQQRIFVHVDWKKIHRESERLPILIKSGDKEITVYAVINNPATPTPDAVKGFVESEGYVSIEAEHFMRSVKLNDIEWKVLPDHGRTLSAITPFPVTAQRQELSASSPHVDYDIHFFSKGKVKVQVYLSPTIDFKAGDGLHYGLSFDDQKPIMVNMHKGYTQRDWDKSVKDNIRVIETELELHEPGLHTLKLWMVDPGVVVQKIVIDTGGLKQSYLGPPESFR